MNKSIRVEAPTASPALRYLGKKCTGWRKGMRLCGCALLVSAGVWITLIVLGQKAFSFELLLWFFVLAMPMICTLNMKHRSAGIFTTVSFILSALIGLWAHRLVLLVDLYCICLFMGGYIGLSLKLRTAK